MHFAPRTFVNAIARRLVPLLVVIAALAVPRLAHAVGRATLANKEINEVDGHWKVNMTIDLGSPPALPNIQMVFRFTPVVQYERTLTDKSGETPVLNKIALRGQAAINEGLDVGFSDGSGKLFKLTKFDFTIRRDHGFEAGEYDLKITRESDGAQIGQVLHLILKGDNVVVDRRSMDFSRPKKVVEKKPKAEAAPAAAADDDDNKGGDAQPASDDQGSSSAAPTEAPAPPPVPPKQGGCGCRVNDGPLPATGGAALAMVALGLAVATRRRARTS